MGGLQGNDQYRHIVPAATEIAVQDGGYHGRMTVHQARVVVQVPSGLQAVAVHDQ
jgi:hypothetical protein